MRENTRESSTLIRNGGGRDERTDGELTEVLTRRIMINDVYGIKKKKIIKSI